MLVLPPTYRDNLTGKGITHMTKAKVTHMIDEVKSFIIDRKSRGSAPNTIDFYSRMLIPFADWLAASGVLTVDKITAEAIRVYLLDHADTWTAGTQHAAWRSIKAFLRWWEAETEPDNWRNPINKVAAPKINTDGLPGVQPDDVEKMLQTCDTKTYYGQRDKALMMMLYDTGMRVTEFCQANIQDVDLDNGAILIRRANTKGGKARTVFIGAKTRREIIRYMRKRDDVTPSSPLFAHKDGSPFKREGITTVLKKAALAAGVPVPSPHDFRRGFAIQALRNGADVLSISRILGHSNMQLVQRYAQQLPDDLRAVHDRVSPIDNLD